MHRAGIALVIASLLVAGGCGRAPVARPGPSSTGSGIDASTPASTATTPRPVPSSTAPPTTPTLSKTPSHPITSTAPAIGPVSAQARAAGLLDVRTVVPDAIIDLRYATSHNFVGTVLYPANARCLIHQSMAGGLRTAADRLRRQGFLLVFWDCYRPHPVQVRMFQIVPDPNWVARPGPYATSHEAGRSVDATLAHAASAWRCPVSEQDHQHCLLDMGTGFDDFTARAHAFASYLVSSQAQADRALLRAAMNLGGLAVYSGEWWHFDGPGSLVHRPILDAPVY